MLQHKCGVWRKTALWVNASFLTAPITSGQRYLSGSLAAVGEAAVAIECETEMRS